MSADLLIHATLTVSGDPALLPAADARIKALLAEEDFEGGFEEHHGDAALSYDFKVRGGVPFPAFAAASQEFPQLAVVAEWVNVGAGLRGRARLADGRIVDHVEEPIATGGAADARNRYFEVAPDGTLQLAFAVVQRDRGVWAGYALNHEHDALFQLKRDGEAIELRTTEGAADWALMWTLHASADAAMAMACEPPQPLARELYAELERLAQDFVGEWIWLREAPAAETAIERERYARYGYTVRDANVRVAKLQRMRGDADVTRPIVYSTLDADSDWIRGVLQRCWA